MTSTRRLRSHVIRRTTNVELRGSQVAIGDAVHVPNATIDLILLLEHLDLIEGFVFRHLASHYLAH